MKRDERSQGLLNSRRKYSRFLISIPTVRRIGMGKLRYIVGARSGSHWHDSTPRVWIRVPPPPGLLAGAASIFSCGRERLVRWSPLWK